MNGWETMVVAVVAIIAVAALIGAWIDSRKKAK